MDLGKPWNPWGVREGGINRVGMETSEAPDSSSQPPFPSLTGFLLLKLRVSVTSQKGLELLLSVLTSFLRVGGFRYWTLFLSRGLGKRNRQGGSQSFPAVT